MKRKSVRNGIKKVVTGAVLGGSAALVGCDDVAGVLPEAQGVLGEVDIMEWVEDAKAHLAGHEEAA